MFADARRLICLVAFFSLSLGAYAVAANAGVHNTQGDLVRFNANGNDNGTRAWLAGTGHPNSTGDVLASVSIQENLAATGGMFQVGEYKSTSDFVASNCGAGKTAVFAEYFTHSAPNTGICAKTSSITAFGNGGRFSVAVGSNGWEAIWNSNAFYDPPPLGFSSGYSIAKAESYVDPTKAAPSFAMTWGPSGQTTWDYKTGSNPYSKILDSYVSENDYNNWAFFGRTSPLNINWQG